MSDDVVVRYKHNFQHEVQAGSHSWIVDEPREVGGDNQGPTPYDLLLAALGSCTSMTMLMYARRKGWPLEDVEVGLSHDRIYAKDCTTCETESGLVDRIQRRIQLKGPLTDDQVTRLRQVADRCPVHQTLENEILIENEYL